jgi:hypothetical protein
MSSEWNQINFLKSFHSLQFVLLMSTKWPTHLYNFLVYVTYPMASNMVKFTFDSLLVGVRYSATITHSHLTCDSFTWLVIFPFDFFAVFNPMKFSIHAFESVVFGIFPPFYGSSVILWINPIFICNGRSRQRVPSWYLLMMNLFYSSFHSWKFATYGELI